MVKNGSFLSSAEILQMVAKLKISKVKLSVANIEYILNKIVDDGKAEMYVDESDVSNQQSKRYRMIESSSISSPPPVSPILLETTAQ